MTYTGSNTDTPTTDPTSSPTPHPIQYSDFESSVTAVFNITGWTNPTLYVVTNEFDEFVHQMTTYIHAGFDNDVDLQYQYVVCNISSINGYTLDHLMNADDSEMGRIIWPSLGDGMNLEYLIECSHYSYCDYIVGNISSTTHAMNRSVFEDFVTEQLNLWFQSKGDDLQTTLQFAVKSMVLIQSTTERATTVSQATLIVFISVGACLFISGVSVGIILYHQKQKQSKGAKVESSSPGSQVDTPDPGTPPKVEVSSNDVDIPGNFSMTCPSPTATFSATFISAGRREGFEGGQVTGGDAFNLPNPSSGALNVPWVAKSNPNLSLDVVSETDNE